MSEAKNDLTSLYSFLYLLCLYLALEFLPLNDWIANSLYASLVKLGILAVILALSIYEIVHNRIKPSCFKNSLASFTLIPLILGCLSNFFYGLLFIKEQTISFNASLFTMDIFISIFSITIEELLFRFLLLTFLSLKIKESKNKDLLVILFSSLAFCLMHVINFFGNDPLSVLAQLGYTFVLGLILGVIAYYYETPFLTIIGHFLFNFLNQVFFSAFYSLTFSTQYLVYSIVFALIMILYTLFLVYLIRRKKHYASS
jgi:membrane protease YdiL (CAAX protease family)